MNFIRNIGKAVRWIDWRAVGICLFFLSMSFGSLNDVFVYIPDSARYLVWAESLSHGHGFTDISDPDQLHYVVHAPLYALLLAPAAFLFPGSVIAAKMLTSLFGGFLILLVYVFLSDVSGKIPALTGALILALNPLQMLYSTQLLSDVPFGALFVLLLILLDRLVQRPVPAERLFLSLCLLVASAVLLREVGIALAIAFGLFFVRRKEYSRAAVIVLLPLAVYALWYFRNEVLVAGMEHPTLRNSNLFVSHFFTADNASLASELAARSWTNLRAYAGLASKLLLLTQYDARGYGIIPPGEFAFGWILKNGGMLVIPTALLTAGTFFTGLWYSWRKRESTRLVVLFLALYLPLILIYPFNDIRFLFPLLLIVLLYSVVGATAFIRRFLGESKPGGWIVVAGIACLVLLVLPNAAWVYSFTTNNARYASHPESYFRSVYERPDAPELLMFPMSRIGEWITQHSKPTSAVATRWKQLYFWLGGRKLVELNPLLPVDQFENQLRDYRVEYLVVLLDRSRLREFETQMAFSYRFSFVPVKRIGNAVIVKVSPADPAAGLIGAIPSESIAAESFLDSLNQADERVQFLFRSGLRTMESGKPEEAVKIFESLTTLGGRSGTVVLYTAIAKSFAGKFAEADTLLRNLQRGQQAGPLLVHSWYHLRIIEMLQGAEKNVNPAQKADLLTRISLEYWRLGFRNHADMVLDRAVGFDGSFAPALVFKVYFSLQKNDTLSAVRWLERLRAVAPAHPAVESYRILLANARAAAAEKDLQRRCSYREIVAGCYERLGLYESAIDEWTFLLRENPADVAALRRLAKAYLDKGRYAPSIRSIDGILELSPGDQDGRKLLDAARDRWGS